MISLQHGASFSSIKSSKQELLCVVLVVRLGEKSGLEMHVQRGNPLSNIILLDVLVSLLTCRQMLHTA